MNRFKGFGLGAIIFAALAFLTGCANDAAQTNGISAAHAVVSQELAERWAVTAATNWANRLDSPIKITEVGTSHIEFPEIEDPAWGNPDLSQPVWTFVLESDDEQYMQDRAWTKIFVGQNIPALWTNVPDRDGPLARGNSILQFWFPDVESLLEELDGTGEPLISQDLAEQWARFEMIDFRISAEQGRLANSPKPIPYEFIDRGTEVIDWGNDQNQFRDNSRQVWAFTLGTDSAIYQILVDQNSPSMWIRHSAGDDPTWWFGFNSVDALVNDLPTVPQYQAEAWMKSVLPINSVLNRHTWTENEAFSDNYTGSRDLTQAVWVFRVDTTVDGEPTIREIMVGQDAPVMWALDFAGWDADISWPITLIAQMGLDEFRTQAASGFTPLVQEQVTADGGVQACVLGPWSEDEVTSYLADHASFWDRVSNRGTATVSFAGEDWNDWDAAVASIYHQQALLVPPEFMLSQFSANCEAWTFDVTRENGEGFDRVYVGKTNLWSWVVADGGEMSPQNTIPLERVHLTEITQSQAEELALTQVSGNILNTMSGSGTAGPVWIIWIEDASGQQVMVNVFKETGILTVMN